MSVSLNTYDGMSRYIMTLYGGLEMRMLKSLSHKFASIGVDGQMATLSAVSPSLAATEAATAIVEIREKRQRYIQKCLEKAYRESLAASIADISSKIEKDAESPKESMIRESIGDIIGETEYYIGDSELTLQNLFTVLAVDYSRERDSEALQSKLNALADTGFRFTPMGSDHLHNIATYAELVSLTALENAVTQAFFDAMNVNSYDLALITGHSYGCPICRAWSDVVISISGNTHGYPSYAEAASAGCFHPRCQHHLELYREGFGDEEILKNPRPVMKPDKRFSTQMKQRRAESEIRRWKRRAAVALDPLSLSTAESYVRYYQAQVRELLRHESGTDLSRKMWREGSKM